MRRPALITTIFFSLGIILAHFTDISFLNIILLLIITSILYLITGISGVRSYLLTRNFCREVTPDSTKRAITSNSIIAILIIQSGVFYYEIRTRVFPENHILEFIGGKRKVISDIVRDPDKRIDRTILECNVIEIDGEKCSGRIRITVNRLMVHSSEFIDKKFNNHELITNNQLKYGQRIKSYGYLYYPDFSHIPSEFDYRSWLTRRDIYGVMTIYSNKNIKIMGKGKSNMLISKVALPIKRSIEKSIDKYIGGNQGAFLKGIIIRQRGLIPKQVQEYFKNTGTIHILAVSGLHVGIIATIIFMLLSIFRISRMSRAIITSLFLILYCFIVDLQVPVIRATIMFIIGMIALSCERETDMFNIIACAGLFNLFINPQTLFDASFQMSFVAVLSIVYLYPKIYPQLFGLLKNRSLIKSIAQLFTVSICAQMGVGIITAYYFFRVPIISIIANLFVIPLTGLSITLGFCISVANLLPFKIIAHLFAGAGFVVTTITLKIIELFSKIPYSHFWVDKPSILFIAFYFLILIFLVNAKDSIKARKGLIYSVLIGLNILLWTNVF